MEPQQVLDYVKASAALLALPLDEARAQRVAIHLQRTAELAQLLEDFALEPHDEIAEIYSPMGFQRPPDGRI